MPQRQASGLAENQIKLYGVIIINCLCLLLCDSWDKANHEFSESNLSSTRVTYYIAIAEFKLFYSDYNKGSGMLGGYYIW